MSLRRWLIELSPAGFIRNLWPRRKALRCACGTRRSQSIHRLSQKSALRTSQNSNPPITARANGAFGSPKTPSADSEGPGNHSHDHAPAVIRTDATRLNPRSHSAE